MSERKKFVMTTKEDIKNLIQAWPKANSNKEVAEMIGKDEPWVSRIVPIVRATGYDLPRKYKAESLKTLIAEALSEMTAK